MKISVVLLTVFLLTSCGTIERQAVRSVADMLSSPEGTGAFTSDDDPQLVGDALPLALKLYEIILEQDPQNAALAAAAGKNFVMYAAAYVQMPASMLDDEQWRESEAGRLRAGKLFRRGRDYLLRSLELRHKEFPVLMQEGRFDEAMALLGEEDADTAYWAALGWLGMVSTDPFNMELTPERAAMLLYRSMELDESNPGVHNIMIQLGLSLPPSILINMRNLSPQTAGYMDRYYAAEGVAEDTESRAFFHYYRALALSEGLDPSPHITMATSLAVKNQDLPAFRQYLNEALAISPEGDQQLMVLIYQEQAGWLLENEELFFLVDTEDI